MLFFKNRDAARAFSLKGTSTKKMVDMGKDAVAGRRWAVQIIFPE